MTLTVRNSRWVYQQGARAGDGVLANALARETGTCDLQVGTESERTQIFAQAGTPWATSRNYIGRLVSLTATPPSSGTAGTNKHDHFIGIVTAVNGGGNALVVEGLRVENAGTATYVIHASVDFNAPATAVNFHIDEGPLGPNSAPYPAVRTNAGPSVGQAINFRNTSNDQLNRAPFMVTALGPDAGSGATATATNARLSDYFDALQTIPTGSGLRWQLIDMPAYTVEEALRRIYRQLPASGMTLVQDRGKNNGTGGGYNIVQDRVFQAQGEDGRYNSYWRVAGCNPGTSASGGYGSGSTSEHGIDFAGFGAWDRAFSNSDPAVNRGNGINAVGAHGNAANAWAAQADTANTSSNQAAFFNPDVVNGSAIPARRDWSHEFHDTASLQQFVRNRLGTPDGGELVKIDYVLVGNANVQHVYLQAEGYGACYVCFGLLEPRAGMSAQVHVLSFSVANGANRVLRLGSINPRSPGVRPDGTADLPWQSGDFIQIAGQTVNAGITPATSHGGEMIETCQITNLDPAGSTGGQLGARGVLTMVAGASITDGATVDFDDGEGNTTTLEFDLNGGGVSGGNVAVVYTAADSANTIATAFAAALGGTALNYTVTPNGANVEIDHGTVGAVGNQPIVLSAQAIADGITAEGMTGGGYAVEVASVAGDYAAGALVGVDPQPMFIGRFAHLNVSTMFTTTDAIRVNNRSQAGNGTYFDAAPPQAAPGYPCFASLEQSSTFREVSPDRSGRYHVLRIAARDEAGADARGYVPLVGLVSAAVGSWEYFDDPNGNVYLAVPWPSIHSSDSELGPNPLSTKLCFGPIPLAHVET